MRKMLIKFIAQENNHNTSNWGGELRSNEDYEIMIMTIDGRHNFMLMTLS